MESLVHAMLGNALAATALAIIVAVASRALRRPALIHGLWLVVMIKLITPPVVPVSLPFRLNLLPAPAKANEAEPAVARPQLETRADLLASSSSEPLDADFG